MSSNYFHKDRLTVYMTMIDTGETCEMFVGDAPKAIHSGIARNATLEEGLDFINSRHKEAIKLIENAPDDSLLGMIRTLKKLSDEILRPVNTNPQTYKDMGGDI